VQWRGLFASAVVRRGLLDSETGAGGASAAGRRPLAFSLLGGVLFLKIARIAAVRIKPAATELDRHRNCCSEVPRSSASSRSVCQPGMFGSFMRFITKAPIDFERLPDSNKPAAFVAQNPLGFPTLFKQHRSYGYS